MTVRAYLDANLYISYLLKPLGGTPPSVVVAAGLRGRFTLVFATPTMIEFMGKIHTKPYLSDRIPQAEVDELLSILHESGTQITNVPATIPAVGRDPKDDYLLTYAAAAEADFLVTGDKDLLVLGEHDGVRIVSPAVFAALLDHLD